MLTSGQSLPEGKAETKVDERVTSCVRQSHLSLSFDLGAQDTTNL